MINSSHVFKELTSLLPSVMEKYKKEDTFFIGLRLANRQVPKVEVLVSDLMPTLFKIIDTAGRTDMRNDDRHPIWTTGGFTSPLLSIFICDATSQTVYDSRYYQQSVIKYNLKKDKDTRVLQFKQHDEKDKTDIIELTIGQIQQLQEDYSEGKKPNDETPDSSWEEMPWD